MATYISHSAEETQALGEAWGRAAAPGLVIWLTGDLGSGKTQLAKGIARGLGVPARVHSPTFTLINQYEGGRLPLFHLDLYRLETPEQVVGAGLPEYFNPAGVSVVEWAERWLGNNEKIADLARGSNPRDRRVLLEVVDESTRKITYEDFGA